MSVIATRGNGNAVFAKIPSELSEHFWTVEFVSFETFNVMYCKEEKQ
jgi:hypothetical protein